MRNSRWTMLGLGTGAQTAGTTYLYGLVCLIPALHAERPGASLAALGGVTAAPGIGMVLGVFAWGAIADRKGERLTILVGLGAAAVLLVAAAAEGPLLLQGLLLVLAGAAGSAVYAASGRVVVGWFPPGQRGLAMGIRQASQPVGVGLAGAVLPALAEWGGVRAALLTCSAACVCAAVVCAFLLVDAHRPAAAVAATGPSPYRRAEIWQLHGASVLLVVAQSVAVTFATDFVVHERRWSLTAAGAVLACAQFAGAVARVAAGRWSDRVADRMVPLRVIAVAATAALGMLAVTAEFGPGASVFALLLAGLVTVSWHGIAYAAVSDAAPSGWTGRAVGAQTTVQNVAAALTPYAFGAGIQAHGYGPAYALAASAPLAAALVLPRARAATRRLMPAGG
ncbi:MFS transporter [Micromonospora sp. SL1-18]|uniref:MFS transporter n=1 Tax=Micromonospora sp. SL1-18 TaxID=3399128 RepID=UPI003A4DF465